MPALRERQPWPLKWVALAIVLAIIPYTWLTLHFRKPGRMFEPYHDMKERANTLRLLSAGFQRVILDAERPAEIDTTVPLAPVFPARGGLPPELNLTLVDRPVLADEILTVRAAARASSVFSYPIELTCTQPDNHRQLGGAELYVHGEQIVVVPDFEPLDGLLARTRDDLIRLTVPAGALKPGRYRVTLIGAHLSKTWSLDVK